MREADEHRKRATFCITLAEITEDQTIKAALIDMAQKWRELADRCDLAEPPPPPYDYTAGQQSPGR